MRPHWSTHLVLGFALLLAGCSATYERRDPVGERFPTVQGKRLTQERVTLPDDLLGAPVLLLIGYQQQTQFDIDRWLLGLHEVGLEVTAYELPTIPGLAPRLVAGRIDAGMRAGIPQEDWGEVITIYRDATSVARFTGTREGRPARVLLLDAEGRVVYFHDRGYSVSALQRLRGALDALHESRGEDRDP